MPQYGVYEERGTDVLLLDCQSDLLDDLPTRVVVPLLPTASAKRLYARLNRELSVAGESSVMMTQLIAAVPAIALGRQVAWLPDHHYRIGGALNVLTSGV